ncbi:acylphosphatase [Aquimarina sp. MMG016]|uniref:acylphosphatase n=1 Tax=Aquimarina sp. MMG016 TaxID=2822690 RepID=UPI001B39D6C3|nr:acylphosphatase [Aquimarina sp. MMG016]MBQ4819681.1 acylphosphatase [Aquimarina sp. MMG016]
MLKHYNIKATGKVQGVWYRQSTLQKATELNLKGFVKNVPDGSVYIEAEGTEDQLQNLLDWCKEGPQFAMVQDVSFKEDKIKSFTDFEILY